MGKGDIPKIRQMFSAKKSLSGGKGEHPPNSVGFFRHKKGNFVTIFSLFSLFLALLSTSLTFFGQPYLMQKHPLAEKSAKHLP